ncbi:MAG: cytochrome C oxidase subunit IV family protein [Acidobacteriales bacterium]|nr:cytochrome C oxidase subunit IV family protein [Terriglobales bacterium]
MAEHIVSPKVYIIIFLALMVMTAVTVAAAFVDLTFHLGKHVVDGAVQYKYNINVNPAVALAIAGFKAALVILFFMHLRWGTRLTKIVVIAGLYWLAILLTTVADYVSRNMMTYPLQ